MPDRPNFKSHEKVVIEAEIGRLSEEERWGAPLAANRGDCRHFLRDGMRKDDRQNRKLGEDAELGGR